MTELPFKLPDPDFRVPDVIGTVRGWRAWRCVYKPKAFEAPKLYSVTHGNYYWHPRKFAEAHCEKRCGPNVPGAKCSCGFYSARSLEHLLSLGYHTYDLDDGSRGHQEVQIIGVIANWGKVVQGSQGWRAQFAYPHKLWVPFEAAHLAQRISETYGVPVGIKNILGAAQGSKSPFLAPNPNR